MTLLKVLIVDDEPGMRLLIEKTVEKLKDFQVIGGAASGEEALKIFEAQKPEVVFLDIELNGMSGVDCAEAMLSINPKAMIIFATGHNEFMPRAFELYAFDYLIKPFKIERILNTLNRIKDITEEKREVKVIEKPKSSIALDKLAIKNKEGIIKLINAVNGNIRNTKRLVQFNKVCILLGIDFIYPIKLTKDNS